MIDDICKDAAERMQKSVESVQNAFKKIRTGRAHPSLLDSIKVEYYGADTPLPNCANIHVEDARTLTVQPWDKSMVPAIEKAIMTSDLGLNPATAGSVIRVPMPMLTEESRKGFIKQARNEAEAGRVAIRNIRRDANSDLKEFLKEKEISEDEEHAGQERIQKLTDQYIAKIDEFLEIKEADLLEV